MAQSNALYAAAGGVRNALADMKKRPKNALIDALRGGLLGATTDTVGYIPDAVADFMRPFGYNVPPQDVVGGTEWLANRVTTPSNSLAENSARFAMGMLTPSITDIARLGKAPMQEMTVYHGSPHDFDKFDMSKIGTGEGAQAYGHGLYVAETPGVAKSYTTAGVDKYDLAANIDKTAAAFHVALDPLSDGSVFAGPLRTMMSKDQFVAAFKDGRITAHDFPPTVRDAVEKKLMPPGRLYTVDLPDSHIANMLDWDAPLSQQPEAVRKALASRLVEDQYNIAGKRLATVTGDPLVGIKLQGALKKNGGDINAAFDELGKLGNESWKQSLAKARAEVDWSSISVGKVGKAGNGSALYADLAKEFGGDAKASEYLRSLGIPGTKYFDGGSRAAGEGSRNHVVFDDKLLKILKKE